MRVKGRINMEKYNGSKAGAPCYLYTRVSTEMQVDGYSLDAQNEKLKRYADYERMPIAGTYSDEGKSGKSVEGRPQFREMLEDIKSGKDNVKYVLVFKLSRFGRNAADVLSSLQLMQDFIFSPSIGHLRFESSFPSSNTATLSPLSFNS